MSFINLVEFIENESEKDVKKRIGMEILSGQKEFVGNISTYETLMKAIKAIKKEDFTKIFSNQKEKAENIEKIIKGMKKERVEEIINMIDEKGLKGDEKELFYFASKIEEKLFSGTYGQELTVNPKNNTTGEKWIQRTFHAIPVKTVYNGKTLYGVIRPPDGIISWEKNIEKWADYPKEKDWLKYDEETREKYSISDLEKMSDSELDDIMDQQRKRLMSKFNKKHGKLKDLFRSVTLIKSGDNYKVERNNVLKFFQDKFKFKFNDSPEAIKAVSNTVVNIIKKHEKISVKEIRDADDISKWADKVWFLKNLDFWKTVRTIIDGKKKSK